MRIIQVNIVSNGGVLSPADLPKLVQATGDLSGSAGICLSGRLPVWAFGALVHSAHATPWVACYDPRLMGGVVVARHGSDAPVLGSVVPCDVTTAQVVTM